VKPPIEDVLKALVEAGLPADEIASTIARMFGSAGDEVAKVADEVIPAKPELTVILFQAGSFQTLRHTPVE
jgi:hypothetical protein